jgi:ABC-type multidrug transport system ATPase subunit
MLKRAAIAQAFIGEPDLILLDEPTAGLDPATAGRLRDLIRDTASRSNFIISSHNLDDIEDLCGSVLILDGGRLSQYKPLAELVGRSTCLTFRLEQAPPAGIEAVFEALPDVTRVETSETGGHYLLVHYHESAGDAAQLQILKTLQQAGLSFLEMSRGQPLERRVMDIVR